MSVLDFSSLGRAIEQLRQGILISGKEPENQLYRDGVIQRFEFTYGLCHRMLFRFLEQTSPIPEEVGDMSFPTLIRTGAERGLLDSGWERWSLYREARNITSHTYDRVKAEQVMSVVPLFLVEAEFLYEQLQRRSS